MKASKYLKEAVEYISVEEDQERLRKSRNLDEIVRADFSRMKPNEEVDAWGMATETGLGGSGLAVERVLNKLVEEGIAYKDGKWYGKASRQRRRAQNYRVWFNLGKEVTFALPRDSSSLSPSSSDLKEAAAALGISITDAKQALSVYNSEDPSSFNSITKKVPVIASRQRRQAGSGRAKDQEAIEAEYASFEEENLELMQEFYQLGDDLDAAYDSYSGVQEAEDALDRFQLEHPEISEALRKRNDALLEVALRPLEPGETDIFGPWRNKSSVIKQAGFEDDPVAAVELEFYAKNEARLYNRFQAIQKNLVNKMARGVYDSNLAVKAFMYVVDDAAKMYVQDFGGQGASWHEMFTKPIREEVARSFVAEFEAEAELGNYDNFLYKKYQKGAGEDFSGLKHDWPDRKFELGDLVRVTRGGEIGEVSYYTDYDEDLGDYRVRVKMPDGSRIHYNEKGLLPAGKGAGVQASKVLERVAQELGGDWGKGPLPGGIG